MAQTPDQIAARWAAGLANAGTKITDGVNSVTVAPGQAAARQKQVWQQNTAAAVDKWATNTARVSLSDWQQAMIQKGAPRIASGATAAQPKFASFMGQLLPHIDRVKSTLPPRGTLDQNIGRATTFIRGMAEFKRTA
jgi:hypothetical protein